MRLILDNIEKSFGDKKVLKGASYTFTREKYTASWAETAPEKQRFSTASAGTWHTNPAPLPSKTGPTGRAQGSWKNRWGLSIPNRCCRSF